MPSILLQYLKNPKVGPNWRAGGPLPVPRRAQRGTLSHFLTSIVAKHQKIVEDPLVNFFSKKSHSAEKIERGTLWDFSTLILSQNIKNLKGDPLGIFFRKSLTMRKKTERGPLSLSRFCMLRGKRGETFLVQFARPNDSIWAHKISQNFQELF